MLQIGSKAVEGAVDEGLLSMFLVLHRAPHILGYTLWKFTMAPRDMRNVCIQVQQKNLCDSVKRNDATKLC